jgi:hypothetical protein
VLHRAAVLLIGFALVCAFSGLVTWAILFAFGHDESWWTRWTPLITLALFLVPAYFALRSIHFVRRAQRTSSLVRREVIDGIEHGAYRRLAEAFRDDDSTSNRRLLRSIRTIGLTARDSREYLSDIGRTPAGLIRIPLYLGIALAGLGALAVICVAAVLAGA